MDRRKILMKMLEDFPIEDVGEELLTNLIKETRVILSTSKDTIKRMVTGILYFQMQYENHKEMFEFFEKNSNGEFIKIQNIKLSSMKITDHFKKLKELNDEIQDAKKCMIEQLNKI